MRPWIFRAFSAPVIAATAVFIVYPIGQGLCVKVIQTLVVSFFNTQSIIDSSGHLFNSWADIMNRADLGFEVMHGINPHNFLTI